MPPHLGLRGEHQDWSGSRWNQRKIWTSGLIWVFTGRNGKGSVNRLSLGLDSLNNFNGLWGVGDVRLSGFGHWGD